MTLEIHFEIYWPLQQLEAGAEKKHPNKTHILQINPVYLIWFFFQEQAGQICLKFYKCINSFRVLMGSDLVFIEPNRQRNYCRLFSAHSQKYKQKNTTAY